MEQGFARAMSVACLASARPLKLPPRHAAPDARDGVDIPGATTGLMSASAGPQTRCTVDKTSQAGAETCQLPPALHPNRTVCQTVHSVHLGMSDIARCRVRSKRGCMLAEVAHDAGATGRWCSAIGVVGCRLVGHHRDRRASGRATTPRRGSVLAEGRTIPVSRRRTAVSADRVVTNRFGMQFICLLLLAQTEN